jgi:hypothetical protein
LTTQVYITVYGESEAYLGSWQLLVISVGGRQRAEGRRQKEERYNRDTSNFTPSNI